MSESDKNLWYLDAIFYELHIRAYRDSSGNGKGDLQGITEKLDYLRDLGVDCIWLLPTFPSPLKDDGYDIADYYGIHSDYGSLEDFEVLVDEAHDRGLRVLMDLVVNHTSDQHPWFVESRSSKESPKRDWYVWSETDEKYQDARIIFLDTEESNWAYDEATGEYYWHRFYTSQPDLNYDNPDVQQAMIDVMDFWLAKGVDGFRVDAVPYLIEREGTNCENLPETHAYLRRLRRFIDEHYPHAVMLCEANQPPEDVIRYFAQGDEFRMGFHFPLMPRIYMSLKKETAADIRDIMERTPPIPANCQWCTFLRNHDELTLEMVTEEERQWMWDQYAPDPRMRLNLGIRRRLAPLLDNDKDKILLANKILFSLPGSPIIYYGDEIGMGDNIWLDDRNGVRTPMQWDESHNSGFSDAPIDELYAPVIDDEVFGFRTVNVAAQWDDPGSLLQQMRGLIQLRKQYPVFSRGSIYFFEPTSDSVLAFQRIYQDQIVICLHNLSNEEQIFAINLTEFEGRSIIDLLGPTDGYPKIRYDPAYQFTLPPLGSKYLLLTQSEITLRPDLVARLRESAQAKGYTLDDLIEEMLELQASEDVRLKEDVAASVDDLPGLARESKA